MNSYIFITTEGYTYQPNSESSEPDIENCQIVGFAKGTDPQKAFENLIKENAYLLDTTFDELTCFELKHHDHSAHTSYFHLTDIKPTL